MALDFQKTIFAVQKRVEYDGSNNPLYIGFAVRGVASSGASWTIHKYTYDGSNKLVSYQTAVGVWDNRASLSYT